MLYLRYPVFKEQILMHKDVFMSALPIGRWYLADGSLCFAWQRPTLPAPCGASTIGAGGLNDRVRNGNECVPSAIVTRHER
jgi:hypothetical protein